MSIVDNILLEAQKRNLSDQDLCKILGTHKSKIYDWKKGRSEPTAENILTIAQFFQVSADYLLTGEENNPTDAKKKTTPEEQPLDEDKQKLINRVMNAKMDHVIKTLEYIDFLEHQDKH